MNKKGSKIQRILKALFKTVIFTIFGLIALILLFGLISRNSTVQTFLINYLSEKVQERFDVDIEIDEFYFSGLRTLNLENVLIRDHKNDTLIFVQELNTNLSLNTLINSKSLDLDETHLYKPEFHLHKYQGDTSFNINYFVRKLYKKKPTDTVKGVEIVGNDIKLDSGLFVLRNFQDSNYIRDKFDHNHFSLHNITAELNELYILKDSVRIDIESMVMKEYFKQKTIHFRKSLYTEVSGDITLEQLDLDFGKSNVSGPYLHFYANEFADWVDFNEKVSLDLDIENSKIHTEDLAYFGLELIKRPLSLIISGNAKGKVNSMNLKNLDIKYADGSFFRGNANIDGLPDIENTFMAISIQDAKIKSSLINRFSDSVRLEKQLNNLSFFQVNGKFEGFYYDFVADGNFNTALGSFKTDINFKLPSNAPARYSGSLSTRNFDMGKLISRPDYVQKINLDASINGKGLDVSTADMQMNANFFNSSINGYVYDSISFSAFLKENLFDGRFHVEDPSLKFDLEGLIDLNENAELIDIKGQLKFADLKNINLSDKYGFLRCNFDVDFQGLNLDETQGIGKVKSLEAIYDEKYLLLDSLTVDSKLENEKREILIDSELFKGEFKGNFKIRDLIADLEMLFTEYKIQLENNQEIISDYYANKKKREKPYSMDWNLNLYDINPVSSLFIPEVYLAKNSNISGHIFMGNTQIFNVFSEIDTIVYDNRIYLQNEFDLSSSKFSDSSSIIAFLLIDSEKQILSEFLEGDILNLEAVWNNRELELEGAFKQSGTDNYARINALGKFKRDSTRIVFKDTDFRVFDSKWSLSPDNEILISNEKVYIESVELNTKSEKIEVEGIVSNDPLDKLKLKLNGFKLRNLEPIINRKIYGILNTELEISNIFNQIQTYGTVSANDLTIEGFLIGDIEGSTIYDDDKKAIILDYKVDRLGINAMQIKGDIKPIDDYFDFNVIALINDTKLNVIEPFTKGIFSELQGSGSGFLNLQGNSKLPEIRGRLKVEKGGLLVNYLNTRYTFDDFLYFETDNISARNMVLKDANGNQAVLNGGIFHSGFRDMLLDLKATFNNFQILNTEVADNSLYYGIANASGNMSILGSFEDLEINANLESEKGTFIHIPTDSYVEIEKENHISFLSEKKEEEDIEKDDKEEVDLSGLSMNLNLSMDNNARMEIIFDRQTGDIIRGTGKGDLNLEIDTRGDFNMFGYYEIEEGSYNFTLLNVVNKEFNIKPGGRISWAGDPYQGELDLTGTYSQNVSLRPIMVSADSIFLSSPQSARRSPVNVNLDLTGPILSPAFEFGIDISDPPIFQGYDFNNDLLAFQNRIQNDQDELNRQVFSLIVLRQFSQSGGNISQPAGRNLSELFTNQLSTYLSSVDDNLEINFDLSGLSPEALADLQLRLSYSFLEGRLRVTREGGFTNATNETSARSIIGDWTVEYTLTQDGRLKAKMFNRNNANVFQPGARSTNTTGVSILYTKSFDEFTEFLAREERKNQKQEKRNSEDSKKNLRKPEEEERGKSTEQW